MNDFVKDFLRKEIDNYSRIIDEITEDEYETMLEDMAVSVEEILLERIVGKLDKIRGWLPENDQDRTTPEHEIATLVDEIIKESE
jgi:hypothetical protein